MKTPDFLLGTWTYRSFLSNPDIDANFDNLGLPSNKVDSLEEQISS